MSEKILLAILSVVVMWLTVVILRRTRGTSVLGWQVAAFTFTFNPAVYFLGFILRNSDAPMDPDSDVESCIVRALILSNLVAIGYLILLLSRLKRGKRITFTATGGQARAPATFWILTAFALIGAITELLTNRGQFILREGLAGIADYKEYYSVRLELSEIMTSILYNHFSTVSVQIALPLVVLFSFQQFLLRRTYARLLRWIVLALFWSINSLLLYQKAPIITVLLGHFTILLLTLNITFTKPIRLWMYGIATVMAVFGLIHIVYAFLGASDSPFESFLLLSERVWGVPMETTYRHFYTFPELHEHTRYSLSTTFNLFLGGGKYVDTEGLTAFQIAAVTTTGFIYNMNTGILGSGWAEFGYLGVIEQAGIVFGVSCLWDLYLMKRFGLLARVLLSAYFLGYFFNIVNGDLMFMLTGGGLIVAPIFVFFLFRSGEALASLTLRKDKFPPVKTQLQEQQNGI